jgi:nucleoside-diphosphate-sugar epimerase
MKILVIGGAGFIGSHVVDQLVLSGHRVCVLDNFTTGRLDNLSKHSNRIEVISGDATEIETVRRACADIRTVFHLAAIPSVQRSIDDPVETQRSGEVATLVVAKAAREQGVRRIVFSSSSSVYGRPLVVPITEASPIRPLSPYAASKAACEGYLHSFSECFGIDTVALRFFNVYGPRQDPNSPYAGVLSIFASELAQGRPPRVYGDGEQTRDYVYVADVVRANILAMEASDNFHGCAINVGSGQEYTLNKVIELLNRVLGTAVQPTYCAPRVGDIRFSLANLRLANQRLGYKPAFSLQDGLAHWLNGKGNPSAGVQKS